MRKIGYLGIIVLSMLGVVFSPQFANAAEAKSKLLEAVEDVSRNIDRLEIANHVLAITRIANRIKEGREEFKEAATLIEESRGQLAEVEAFKEGSDKEKTITVIFSLESNLNRISEILDKIADTQREILEKRDRKKPQRKSKKRHI